MVESCIFHLSLNFWLVFNGGLANGPYEYEVLFDYPPLVISMSDTPPALPPASERDWLTFEEVAEKDSEFRAAANAAPKPAPEAEAAALKCLTSEIE